MTSPQQIAEAFSGHRFDEAYDHLAADVGWVLVGGATLAGRDEVVAACEQTAAALAGATTEFLRFRTVVGTDAVAVDAIARYVDGDGTASLVSSCDIYEFESDVVTTITSYTVELGAVEEAPPR